jgi:hypothetical protein
MINHTLEFVHEGLSHFRLTRNICEQSRTHTYTHQNQTLPEHLHVTKNMAARISLLCMMGNQREKTGGETSWLIAVRDYVLPTIPLSL